MQAYKISSHYKLENEKLRHKADKKISTKIQLFKVCFI